MKFRKVLAATLVATMTLSTAVFAAEDTTPTWNNDNGEETIQGDATVVQPVLEVALPGDLAFVIDPLKIENDMQVIAGDYNVTNFSNVPVKITMKPSIVTTTDSKLEVKTAAPALNETLDATKKTYADLAPTDNKKSIFLAAIPAEKADELTDANGDGIYEFAYPANTGGTIGRTAFEAGGTEEEPTWTASAAAAVESGDVTDAILTGVADTAKANTATNSLTFVLKKPTLDAETGALTGVDAIASFTVCGAVDPAATFEDGEVRIQAAYKMEVLSKNEYSTTVGTGAPDDESKMSTKCLNTLKTVTP